MLIIMTKPGFTVDSRKPKRKRFAAVPAKLVQAGVVIRIIPHPTDVLEVLVDKDVGFRKAYQLYKHR
jgi:hypothetical protein